MNVRDPYVAGYFYPGTAAELRKMLAGLVDEKAPKEDVIGLLVPHAGYQYSGPVTGAAVSRIKMKDTFVIMGPTHTGRGRPYSIMAAGTWKTPLGNVEVDAGLAQRIIDLTGYLEADELAHQEEHAVEVQLPFLQYFKPDVRIVPIILGGGAIDVYQKIGKGVAAAIKELKREAVILASGDMTHYEPQQTARDKDMKAVEAMLALDEAELTRRYQGLHITMCAYGPAACLIAAAKEMGANTAELVKYMTSGDTTGDFSQVVGYAGVIFRKVTRSPLVELAWQTVEMYVKEGKTPPPPADLAPEMKEKAGVFVSIHKKNGALRGCIGTFEPQQENVAEEVIANAVSAATRDPRFSPLTARELPDLDFSVDVLTHPEPVADISQLDPKKYGVIAECGWRRGLLLPDLEGVDRVEDQVSICCQKGGIAPGEPVQLYRFEVKRYK
jgi:AmmeMemoRadiSam system protein B/AmmeMemoRadiSam system protein A